RARLRELMPALAREGLSARSLSRLAGRLRRADAAIEMAVDKTMEKLCRGCADHGPIAINADELIRLPAEVALRVLGRMIARAGARGRFRLGRLECLSEPPAAAHAKKSSPLRPTRGGALQPRGGSGFGAGRPPPRRSRSAASMAGKLSRR